MMKRAYLKAPEPAVRAEICSFPPIATRTCRVLVLGSMPGIASLRAGRYYAHPHNAFWPIMGELFGAGPALAYAKRIQLLRRNGLAVWDVMASCIREGSLDADIDGTSIVPNDFQGFFRAHPQVRHVFFNGSKAEECFRRYVRLADPGLSFTRLPSTSPAHASRTFAQKLAAWRVVAQTLAIQCRQPPGRHGQ